MIDFHSHILPGIDDGSRFVEESLKMLQLSFRQGVTEIVATPHFYAQKESPEHFLMRREKSWMRLVPELLQYIPESQSDRNVPENGGKSDIRESFLGAEASENCQIMGIPAIHLGAEVYYYTGISGTECLSKLCIGNSNVLLLEMPFHRWTDHMIEEAISLAQDTEMIVLLAHIDRYLDSQKAETWERLANNGILFQLNASAFLDGWGMRRKACSLVRSDRITVLGSDCHNMGSRKPNLREAADVIRKKCGEEALQRLTKNAERLLKECTWDE